MLRIWSGFLLFVLFLSACSSNVPPTAPTLPTETSTPTVRPPATQTSTAQPPPAATHTPAAQESLLFEAGLRYPDKPDDIAFSFLDVVAFEVVVDEGSETVEATFFLRDIPPAAPLGAMQNVIQYQWTVEVYLDPAGSIPPTAPDYALSAFSFAMGEPAAASDAETPEPNPVIQGTAVETPFDQLITSSSINDRQGESVAAATVTADPDNDTFTIRGRVPGVKESARFSFSTFAYGEPKEIPDANVVGSAIGAASTRPDQPAESAEPDDTGSQLQPAGKVRAYPGPEHYAGDVLTIEVALEQISEDGEGEASIRLDGGKTQTVPALWQYNVLILPLALNTEGLSGEHSLQIQASQGSSQVEAEYHFVVKPAFQRPEQEERAAWQSREIACCVLHYITHTAAGRDIDAIAEVFQQAAVELAAKTGKRLEEKFEVYFIDRMWGNGAFGGGGELVVSYTDRYYGPAVGLSGLKTLALHEMTHAAGIDTGEGGITFYNEGLAVYMAGGHFKREPIPERGAALLELGYSLKVRELPPQHELAYLAQAVFWNYVDETYGQDARSQFVEAASEGWFFSTEELNSIFEQVFGVSVNTFNEEMLAWVKSHPPGDQVNDLRLTVELQNLRRNYQEKYAPPPAFIFSRAEEAIARPEYLPVVIREASDPARVAVELMISAAQQAIAAGEYAQAESLVAALQEVIDTESFENPLAADYLAITQALIDQGYEPLNLMLSDGKATARVTRSAPKIEEVNLEKQDGVWEVGMP